MAADISRVWEVPRAWIPRKRKKEVAHVVLRSSVQFLRPRNLLGDAHAGHPRWWGRAIKGVVNCYLALPANATLCKSSRRVSLLCSCCREVCVLAHELVFRVHGFPPVVGVIPLKPNVLEHRIVDLAAVRIDEESE